MKRKMKCVAISLALVLAVSVFSGCGNSNQPSTTGSNTPSPASGSTPAPGPAGPAEAPQTSITVEVFDRGNTGGSDPTNNFFTDWIKQGVKEDLNIDVTYVAVPRNDEVSKLNVLMAAGQAPDIAFTYTQSVVYNYYKDGGLHQLDDHLANYGQNLSAYLGEPVLEQGRFFGDLYSLPAKRISLARTGHFIRKDWLDTLGLALPSTKDEYHQALVAFKQQNPGKVDGVIPLGAGSNIPWQFGNIVESFYDLTVSDEVKYTSDVAGPILMPGYKEGYRYINQLYNEGLIDPEFILNSNIDEKFQRGVMGSFIGNYDQPLRGEFMQNLTDNVPGAEVAAIDAHKNAQGQYAKGMYGLVGLFVIVPTTCKYPESAVKYLDWLSQDENRIFLVIGEEGVHHTLDENGIPVMQTVTGAKIMNSANNLDYALVLNGVDLGEEDKNVAVLSKSYRPGLEDLFMQSYNIAMTDTFTFPTVGIPIESNARLGVALTDKRNEFLAAAITASVADFDKVYDAGLKEFMIMGGQEVYDERVAAWKADRGE